TPKNGRPVALCSYCTPRFHVDLPSPRGEGAGRPRRCVTQELTAGLHSLDASWLAIQFSKTERLLPCCVPSATAVVVGGAAFNLPRLLLSTGFFRNRLTVSQSVASYEAASSEGPRTVARCAQPVKRFR